MRILLVAYEFPPLESAQALRWGYLARELARRGHELDVVTARLLPALSGVDPTLPITVHQTFPGPFVGASAALRARLPGGMGQAAVEQETVSREEASPGAAPDRTAPPGAVGFAERVYRLLRGIGDRVLVPDVRSEWVPWATAACRRLIAERGHDLLISSHEPGASLRVALRLRRSLPIPWLADFGDPVVTGTTPRWRRPLDLRLERRAVLGADRVVVTTERARAVLAERHGQRPEQIDLLPQGFDPAPPIAPRPGPLRLLFTGTLYAGLRDPRPLIEALRERREERLDIVGQAIGFRPEQLAAPPNVRFVGKRSHADVLTLQRQADVLVNVGNDNAEQVPGKLFEYFGANRPILQLRQHAGDAGARLLEELGRGPVVANEPSAIAAAIGRLAALKAAGELDAAFDLDPASVVGYSWQAHGEILERICREATR